MAGLPPVIASFVERAYVAMDGIDYYGVLGIGAEAGEAEIRAAYYRLARRLHPDVYGDALDGASRRKLTAVFSRVVEAYQVLANGAMRARYDELVREGLLRWDEGEARRPKPAPELSIEHAGARQFFKLGAEAARAGDHKSAATNFRLARSLDPGSALIEERLSEAEENLKKERKG